MDRGRKGRFYRTLGWRKIECSMNFQMPVFSLGSSWLLQSHLGELAKNRDFSTHQLRIAGCGPRIFVLNVLLRDFPEHSRVSLNSLNLGSHHESESHSVVSNSLWPHGLHSPRNSPAQNTRVGCHFLLPSPGDLLNPGIELRSPTLQADSLPTELPSWVPHFPVSPFAWPTFFCPSLCL